MSSKIAPGLRRLGKLCTIRAVAPESFALAGQGARSVVGSLPMSEEQRRPGGAKARPLRDFAHKGTPAALPGLAIGMAMALRRDALHLMEWSAPLLNSASMRQTGELNQPDEASTSQMKRSEP